MKIDLEDVRHHFALLSDEALLATNRNDLIEEARQCLDEEVAKRRPDAGLVADPGPEPAWQEAAEVQSDETAAGSAAASESERGAVVSIASYTHPDEARLARGLLEVAGIPSFLVNEQTALGALHLLVPADQVDAALEILADDISEEELAAQAEAAGFTDSPVDDDSDEDPEGEDR